MAMLKLILQLNLNVFQEFSVCHWNLNSIATHSCIKVSLLKTYITIYNYNVISLLETYLDSSIPSDDNNMEIPSYDLIRADHTCNRRRLCLLQKFTTIINTGCFLITGMYCFWIKS